METCDICGKQGAWLHLYKCPICHKHYCESCEIRMGGRSFCSKECGYLFFFSDVDEEGKEEW